MLSLAGINEKDKEKGGRRGSDGWSGKRGVRGTRGEWKWVF